MQFEDILFDIKFLQLSVLLMFISVITELYIVELFHPADGFSDSTVSEIAIHRRMVIVGGEYGLYLYIVQQIRFRNSSYHTEYFLYSLAGSFSVFEYPVLVILFRGTVIADGERKIVLYQKVKFLFCQQCPVCSDMKHHFFIGYAVLFPWQRTCIAA